MCPGELQTIFRESGVTLEIPLKTKLSTENLNPAQRAIFEVVVKNESPYREPSSFVLRVVDGRTESIRQIISTAYEAAEAHPSDAASVLLAIEEAAGATIAKNSPDVKRIVSKVKTAAQAKPADALHVADTASRVAGTAPREFEEFGDAIFSVNGVKVGLGSYTPLEFINGDSLDRQKHISQTYLNLAVEPGFRTRSIKYMQLRLESQCESGFAHLYRDPIGYTQNLDPMSWNQPCPKVQFDESTVSKYLFSNQSPSTAGVLELKMNNPDQYVLWPDTNITDTLMNPRLKLVRLQYRPVSGGEWITAKDEGVPETDKKFNILCDHSRSEGCKFDWKVNNQYEKLLSGFKDNVYELRVKNFCFGGPSLAEPSVHEYVSDQRLTMTVDTKLPMQVRKYSASHEFFGIQFDEPIDCSAQVVTIFKKNSKCNDEGKTMDTQISEEALRGTFTFKCSAPGVGATMWTVQFPPNESGKYLVQVTGVRDASANEATPFRIWANAHCDSTKFGADIQQVKLGSTKYEQAPSSASSLLTSTWLTGLCVALMAIAAVLRRSNSMPRKSIFLMKESDCHENRSLLRESIAYGSTV